MHNSTTDIACYAFFQFFVWPVLAFNLRLVELDSKGSLRVFNE